MKRSSPISDFIFPDPRIMGRGNWGVLFNGPKRELKFFLEGEHLVPTHSLSLQASELPKSTLFKTVSSASKMSIR